MGIKKPSEQKMTKSTTNQFIEAADKPAEDAAENNNTRNYLTVGIRFNKKESDELDELVKKTRFTRAFILREALYEYVQKNLYNE